MYCNDCGTKLPDNAKFCNECGAKIGVVKVAGETTKISTNTLTKSSVKKKCLAIPEIIMSAVFVFAITFLPIFRFCYEERVELYNIMERNKGEKFGLFQVIGEDGRLGVYCIIAWLLIIATLVCYIRLSQLERDVWSFVCVIAVIGICILIICEVLLNYSVTTPSGQRKTIVLADSADSGDTMAIFALLFMVIRSVSTLIANMYEKIYAIIRRKSQQHRENRENISQ
ncbi:MAG: zinc-ribbon domain-containing protein [Ruminococcus sp.]|nr:zinc-ribbon domain-containing protein [Ruminococcus sp.]